MERAAPPSAERAGGRRRGAAGRASQAAACRARGCRPRRAGCAAAGRAPGRASVSSLLRRRRPKHAGGRPRRFLSRRRRPSARAGVRFELAAPPTTERAGGDLRRFCHTAAGRARESPRRGSFLLYLLPAVVAVGLGARSQRGWRQGSRSGWRRGRHLRWRMRGCRRWRRRRPTSHGIGEDRGR